MLLRKRKCGGERRRKKGGVSKRACGELPASWARENLWENLLKLECEARSQDLRNRPSGLEAEGVACTRFLNATGTSKGHEVTTPRPLVCRGRHIVSLRKQCGARGRCRPACEKGPGHRPPSRVLGERAGCGRRAGTAPAEKKYRACVFVK